MSAVLAGSPKRSSRAQARGKPTIFLVEDDQDISRLMRYHLEQAGFAVSVFPAATSVLRSAEEAPPALFLLDVMAPKAICIRRCCGEDRLARRASSMSAQSSPRVLLAG